MALTTQQQAVTGRKIPSYYTDIINAMTPYLPESYAQKEESEHQEEMYQLSLDELALAEDELTAYKESIAMQDALAQEALSEQKKQGETSELMGWLGLGMSGVSGVIDAMGGIDVLKDIIPSGESEMYDYINELGITDPVLREAATSSLTSPVSEFIEGIPVIGDIYDVGTDIIGAIVPDFIKDLGSDIYESIGDIFDQFI